jgi:hypothetical protein
LPVIDSEQLSSFCLGSRRSSFATGCKPQAASDAKGQLPVPLVGCLRPVADLAEGERGNESLDHCMTPVPRAPLLKTISVTSAYTGECQ